MSRKAVVTGGSGFLGRRLVRRLLAEGWEVTCLARPGGGQVPGASSTASLTAYTREGILSSPLDLRGSVIFNAAAYGVHPGDRDPRLAFEVNLSAPMALLERAAQDGALAFVSCGSCAEYAPGNSMAPRKEADPLNVTEVYGATKAAWGLAGSAASLALGLPFIHLRFFHLFGPGEAPHRLLPCLISAVNTPNRVSLSKAEQVRDFMAVDDAVDALLAAANLLADPGAPLARIFNVATGRGTRVRDFALAAAEVLGLKEDQLGFGDLPMRDGEVMHLVGSPSNFQDAAQWAPRFGIRNALEQVWAEAKGAERS